MPPLFDNKNPSSPSVFVPAALLREARRQKRLTAVDVPHVCILDPDGDIVRRLRDTGQAQPFDGWPCYHTKLDTFTLAGQTVGIVGCVVGAPFAVLVAEELFASDCRLLVSLTSAGQITPAGRTPYFVIIERALRDEGTSYHYAAPSEYSEADPRLVSMAADALRRNSLSVVVGSSWTTDAPFRETAEAIEAARSKGVLAVEMEAAALYTFARATNKQVLCLAHVTNTMAQSNQDFEKGEADGAADALRVIEELSLVDRREYPRENLSPHACLLMAQSRHGRGADQCPLSGVKRTCGYDLNSVQWARSRILSYICRRFPIFGDRYSVYFPYG
jgi:uridine phosphorylase